MNLTQDEFVTKLVQVGAESWQLYTVMMAYSTEGNRCIISQQQLMDSLGIGKTALNNRLRNLREADLIEVSRQGAFLLKLSPGFTVVAISDKSETNEKTNNEPAKWTTSEVMALWQRSYKSTYGTDYRPGNWAKDMAHVKLLMTRHDQATLTRIFEVVFRLYAKRWATGQYPRPTIGQMVSWLAAQAKAMASSDQTNNPTTEADNVLTIEGKSLEEMMDEKGWL